MAKLHLAALLALSAASVQAPAAPVVVQPSVDSAEQRQALRSLTACLAQARPRWARQTLSRPYLSEAQASAAAEALSGRDTCLPANEAEIPFRTSGLVGSLAEHFVRKDLDSSDFNKVAAALATATPLNASEDFALCLAARNPAGARRLALSEPGSGEETEAARQLAAHVAPCTQDGEQLTVDLQSMRALVATALYRGIRTASGN